MGSATGVDLQAAWLLLRYCASARANYLLRVWSPAATATGLLGHTDHPLPEGALQTAQLAAGFGGPGLCSALSDRHAAHWASWCDALPVLRGIGHQRLQGPLAHSPRAQGYTVRDWQEAMRPPADAICRVGRQAIAGQGGHQRRVAAQGDPVRRGAAGSGSRSATSAANSSPQVH